MLSNTQESKSFLTAWVPWRGSNVSSKTGTEAVITGVTILYYGKLQYTNHWSLPYIGNSYKIPYLKLSPRRRRFFPWKTGNPFPCSTTMLQDAFYGTDSCRLSDSSVSTSRVDFSLSTSCLHTTINFPVFLFSTSISRITYFGTFRISHGYISAFIWHYF